MEMLEPRLLMSGDVAATGDPVPDPVPAEIHGVKWHDLNADGERQDNEPGLAGVTVYLDLNRNGVLDDEEPHTVTMEDNPDTTADETGHYWLRDVEPDDHLVREVVPDGFMQTFPRPDESTDVVSAGGHIVIAEPGDVIDGIDFGNVRPGSIHGRKWHDRNADGQRQTDERGIAGVTIYLDQNRNGQLDDGERHIQTMEDNPDTVVDETGLYWFDGLRPDEYVVREIVPEGFAQTFPGPLGTPNDPPGAHVVDLDAGEVFDDAHFGNVRLGSIHGRKWHDRNVNREYDPNEEGLAGVTVYLDLNHNGQLDDNEPNAVTMEDDPVTDFDEAGLYWFDGLRPNRYVVREIVPDGFVQTFPGPLGTPNDPPGAHVVHLEAGDHFEHADFGNVMPGSIHGLKWHDLNADGEQQDDEPGLAGVTVYLDLNRNGRLENHEPHVVTMDDIAGTVVDETGMYWFERVLPGEYIVREVVPEGFVQTFPRHDASVDSAIGAGHFVEVRPGEVVEDVDFANATGGSIHGVKWHDRNMNGQRDDNEEGLPGVTIYLDLNRNEELDDDELHTRTMHDNPFTDFDEGGLYWFRVLPGEYMVREVVPDGFVQTFPLEFFPVQEPRGGGHFVVVDSGQTVEGIDFGNVALGSIHGMKWHDRNANGERNLFEEGLAGVTVYLDLNRNGELDEGEPRRLTMDDNPNTPFDDTGLYWFNGLLSGTYVVREIVPEGFAQTFPRGPISSDGEIHDAHIVRLEAGEHAHDVNFGNVELGSVHGIKWHDRNANGEREAGEEGLAGVVIYSDLNHNGELNHGEPHAVTMPDNPFTSFDETGLYWLKGLMPGRHVIREIVPDGFVQTFPRHFDTTDGSIGGGHIVDVEAGEAVLGINFGNLGLGSIHGLKWNDENANRERDPGEEGLPGVTIYLDLNHNGELNHGEPQTVTMQDDPDTEFDEAGHYWMRVAPGWYVVREVVPDGWYQTFPGPSLIDHTHVTHPDRPDILPPGGHIVDVGSGEAVDGIDFGNAMFASIHGTKWHDANANGERESHEEGVSGVIIYADTNRNGELDPHEPRTRTMQDDPTTDFDESGLYWLGVRAGEHAIREVVPQGWVQTFPDPAGGGAHVVEVEPGDTIEGKDFGNFRVSYFEDFEDGVADLFNVALGNWDVVEGKYLAEPQIGGRAISVLNLPFELPPNVLVEAELASTEPGGGRFSNAVVIFNYDDPQNFSYAGAFFGAQKWRIGSFINGDHVRHQMAADDSLVAGEPVEVVLTIVGREVSLIHGDDLIAQHTFRGPQSEGQIALGTFNAIGRFDNVGVQPLHGAILPHLENFNDGVANFFREASGHWFVNGAGRYRAAPTAADADPVALLHMAEPLPDSFAVDVDLKLKGRFLPMFHNALVVFDYEDEGNYKFAGAFVGADQWRIGHVEDGQWFTDARVEADLEIGQWYDVSLRIHGDRAVLFADGDDVLAHAFDGQELNDGQIGLGTRGASSAFDNFSVRRLPSLGAAAAFAASQQTSTGTSAEADNLLDEVTAMDGMNGWAS